MNDVATVNLRYVQAYTDRHGKRRHYFRRPGQKRVTLPGDPGSPRFIAAYAAALAQAPRPVGAQPATGTVAALILAYLASPEFAALSASTQVKRRQLLDGFRVSHGEEPYKGIKEEHVRSAVYARSGPEARVNVRKAILALFAFAQARKWLAAGAANPAAGVKLPRTKSDGFVAWTAADVERFRARWPSGTRERLAMELLLGTGQRRGDIPGMGRQHLADGRISVRQSKTGRRLRIPVHPDLATELALATGRMTFLETAKGAPFSSPASFGMWFGKACEAAGVDARAHGLRKLQAARLAEAGASASEIAAITGHRTLSEVARYTESADQAALAEAAMARLSTPQEQNCLPAGTRVSNRLGKPL